MSNSVILNKNYKEYDGNFGLGSYDGSYRPSSYDKINTANYIPKSSYDIAEEASPYQWATSVPKAVGEATKSLYGNTDASWFKDYSTNGTGGSTAIKTGSVKDASIPEGHVIKSTTVDSDGNTKYVYGQEDGFFSQNGGLGLGLAGLNTGMGIIGGLDAMKTAKLQRKGMEQTYDYNQYQIDRQKNYDSALASAWEAKKQPTDGLGTIK